MIINKYHTKNIFMSQKLIISIQEQLLELTHKNFSLKYIERCLIPIFEYINNSKKKKFLISGSQGIGKSTLVEILKKNFKIFYQKKILILSLDDYYLKKNQRLNLSKNKHPLLSTRGVPGTHDIKKLRKDINSFDKSKYPINIPIFDKLTDDRLTKTQKVNSHTDILILEGWCCGCPPISRNFLYKNINKLEKEKDTKKIWRDYFNRELKNDYYQLFAKFDKLIYLEPPSFSYILNWRLKQEKMLARKNNSDASMNKNEIAEFISHYEKITKWMMKILPAKANICIKIDRNQKIIKLKINK